MEDQSPSRSSDLRQGQRATALENELCQLWAQVSAATYQFLLGVREMESCVSITGFKTVADWLGYCCGIGPVAAREKVRVANALADLPQISLAFSKGEISYSKVRAMTRVATAGNEHLFLQCAHYGTASHVEKLVRLYRRYGDIREAEDAHAQYRGRFARYRWEEDGTLRLDVRLPPDQGALVMKALESVESALIDDMGDGRDVDDWVSAGTAQGAGMIERADLSGERTHGSADGKATPYTSRKADALVQMAEQVLQDGVKKNGAASESQQVVIHVDAATLHGGDSLGSRDSRVAETRKSDSAESHHKHDSAESCCELEDGPNISAETARRISCDATRVTMITEGGEPLALGRKTRQISTPLRRALKARDKQCRFPGCHRHKFTEAHHIHHWADGGKTNLDNLVTLCRFHHRLLHEGGFSIDRSDEGDNTLIFRNRQGRRIQPARPMPTSHPVELLLRNYNKGIHIDLDRLQRYRWHGEVCDYGVFVDHLVKADKLAAAVQTIPRKHAGTAHSPG